MKDLLGEIQDVSEAVLSAEDEEEKNKAFLVLIQGEQTGPFLESTIQTRVLSGEVSRDDLCWTAGMAEWQPIHSVIKLPSLPEPPLPEIRSEIPPTNYGNSILSQVQGFIRDFAGLPPLEGFKFSHLFSEAFKRKSRDDVDTYFTCGCQKTTPDLAEVSPDWPRPWFYLRMLIFGLVVLLGFSFAAHKFMNTNMIPGLIIVGAFFVPLACVSIFFEFNVLRNISLYQVLKFIVGGGILALLLTLIMSEITSPLYSFLGATAAGIIEEPAKALVAVFLIRGSLQYKWILNGLLVGAAVGAGFAGFETAGYIFNALLQDLDRCKDLSTFYGTLEQRAILAPFGHVVWTASIVGALWRVKGDRPFRVTMFFHKDFLRIFIFVMLLHMLWNSGLLFTSRNIVLLRGQIFFWLVSFVGSWYLALLLVQQGLLQVKEAKQLSPRNLLNVPADSALPVENNERFSAVASNSDKLSSIQGGDPQSSYKQKSKSVLIAVIVAIAMAGSFFIIRSGGGANHNTDGAPFVNSLGMKFVPVPGTEVLFSVWDTRVKDFAAFVEASGYNATTAWQGPKFSQTADHPVVNVNWKDAKAFCRWLTEKERSEGKIGQYQEYRLPTDEEWSVAVGLPPEIGNSPKEKDGKVKGVYPWGTQWPPPKGSGNYDPDYGVDSYDNTSPVGSFPANHFGLFDLGGNVWQWCEDWYSDDQGSPVAYRVSRGGVWLMPGAGWLLSSRRHKNFPETRCEECGFRCVLEGKSLPVSSEKSKVEEANADAGNMGTRKAPFVNKLAMKTPPAAAGMSLIPTGSFQMGDSLGDLSDAPVHKVNVSAFYMEKNLVTMALWDEVRAWGLKNGYTDLAVGEGKAANHPI